MRTHTLPIILFLISYCLPLRAADPTPAPTLHPGYAHLRHSPYLPREFSQNDFDALWMIWPDDLRQQAKLMPLPQRRIITMKRYGILLDPASPPDDPLPVGYVVDQNNDWHMNCLACHQGSLEGKLIPGLPNQQFDLQSLAEDMTKIKLLRGRLTSVRDFSALAFPMSTTSGTTNAVMFGVAFVAQRNADMSLRDNPRPVNFVHHDMDAPPWWHYARKDRLYIDGFSPKYHRILMQFSLVPTFDKDQIYAWESDFVDIENYLSSLQPPTYPGEINNTLARQGAHIFNDHCASCHGTYKTPFSDDLSDYSQRTIAIDEIGTDRVRYDSIGPEHRQWIKDSWLSDYGQHPVTLNPTGYLAPPLDGIWASAPYLHNGSVPTLWHLLRPDHRPDLWFRHNDQYDHQHMGLNIDTPVTMPSDIADKVIQRRFFDTTRFGKSHTGHDYPQVLTEPEKSALLEYLKSL